MVSISWNFQSTFEEQINFENQWRLMGQGTCVLLRGAKTWPMIKPKRIQQFSVKQLI